MYPNVTISFTSEEYRGVIVTYMRVLDRFAWNCTIGASTYGDFIVLAPRNPERIEPEESIAAAHIVKKAAHASIDAILKETRAWEASTTEAESLNPGQLRRLREETALRLNQRA